MQFARISLFSTLLLVGAILLLSFGASPVVADDDEFASEWTVTLTEANFDDMVTNSSSWLIKFYAPWCTHCKKLAPSFNAAAKTLQGKLAFGKVDCTTNQNLARRFGVRGFPTIKFWREGHVRNYRHARTEEGLVEFANMVTGSSLTPIRGGLPELEELERRLPAFVLVLLPANKAMPKLVDLAEKVYLPLSRRYQGQLPFFSSDDEAVFQRFKQLKADSVMMVMVKQEPNDKHYSMALMPGAEPDVVARWIEMHRFPYVTELDGVNFEDVTTAGGKKTVIAVLDGDADEEQNKRILDHLRKISKARWGILYRFGFLSQSKWKSYLSRFNIETQHLPTVFLLDAPNDVYWQPETLGENGNSFGPILSLSEIDEFLEAANEGRLTMRGNTPWSFSGIMKRFADYVESFTDTELILIAVGVFGAFLVVLILITVCGPDTPLPPASNGRNLPAGASRQQRRQLEAVANKNISAQATTAGVSDSKTSSTESKSERAKAE